MARYKGVKKHSQKKRRRRAVKKMLPKVIRLLYVISFYACSVYVIEYRLDLNLFVKLAALYGVIKFLEYITKLSK